MTGLGGILALDAAGRTGWAYAPPGAARPFTGIWELPTPAIDLGRALAAFENELLDAIEVHRPSLIAIEAPLPAGAQTHHGSALFLIGLYTCALTTCYRHSIPVKSCNQSTTRKQVVGRGRFGSSGEAKAAVLAYCQAQGWPITDHNAADAAVLWRFACMQQVKSERAA